MNGAVIAITPGGRKLAMALGASAGFTVYLPDELCCACEDAIGFSSLKEALALCFKEREALVLIMACGITVRLLAPLLGSKQTDPAVVVMDEAGRFAISLLSGHWGGANALANHIGELTGATPVITTATDVRGLLAIDVFARQNGLRPEPFARVKELNAAMVRGETVAVFAASPGTQTKDAPGLVFYPLSAFSAMAAAFPYRALLTNQVVFPGSGHDELYLRPPNLYLGVGCRRGVAKEQILAVIRDVLGRFNLAESSVAALVSIEAKQDEPGLLAAAEELGVPTRFYRAEEIRELKAPYEVSSFVYQKMGVGAVCEPTAMLAAGSTRLLVPKQQMDKVTVAVAEAEFLWSASAPVGKKR